MRVKSKIRQVRESRTQLIRDIVKISGIRSGKKTADYFTRFQLFELRGIITNLIGQQNDKEFQGNH